MLMIIHASALEA